MRIIRVAPVRLAKPAGLPPAVRREISENSSADSICGGTTMKEKVTTILPAWKYDFEKTAV
jgi:hypothetical protein